MHKTAEGSETSSTWTRLLEAIRIFFVGDSKIVDMEDGDLTSDNLPEEFDARNHWPKCTSLGAVWNQGACSSCWAISVTTMISDRICVRSQGEVSVSLSADHLVSCCDSCSRSDGCLGGDPRSALWYFYENGLVTGGPFGSKQGCQPYSLPPCDFTSKDRHHSPTCILNNSLTCRQGTCDYHYDRAFANDLFKAEKPPYQVRSNVEAIKKEILNNGPILAIFLVGEDFDDYNTGVYRPLELNASQGGAVMWHSARVIGWGQEGAVPYWTAVNSWGDGWGESGFFRILRGSDECHFESNMLAITPSIQPSSNHPH